MLFQPGENKSVILVSIGGKRVIRGGNGIVDGSVDSARWLEILGAVTERGFGNREEPDARFGLFVGLLIFGTTYEDIFTSKLIFVEKELPGKTRLLPQ